MRETKFRGMDVNGKWHYGNITILKQDIDSSRKAGCYISNSAGMPFAYNVRPDSVGQFTGLHDKNGKEIYEGDLVRYGQDEPLEIIYRESCFCFNQKSRYISRLQIFNNENKLKVVGNIHENPELING